MSDPHLALRQAADYVSVARDDIDADGLDVAGEEQFVEICDDLTNTLRQLALLAEAGNIDEEGENT
jgi:ABC-type metal ion transport system substrate-binding protein